jgi:hypothetical protein
MQRIDCGDSDKTAVAGCTVEQDRAPDGGGPGSYRRAVLGHGLCCTSEEHNPLENHRIQLEYDVLCPVARCWKRFEAARFLALRGADVNFQDLKGRTALRHVWCNMERRRI